MAGQVIQPFATQAIGSTGGLSQQQLSAGLSASPQLSGITPSMVTGATAPTSQAPISQGSGFASMGSLPGIGNLIPNPQQGGGGQPANIATDAASKGLEGAELGANAGPWGAAIGGIAGAGLGVAQGLEGGQKDAPKPEAAPVRTGGGGVGQSYTPTVGTAVANPSPLDSLAAYHQFLSSLG